MPFAAPLASGWCSWGVNWGEKGYLRMRKQAWQGGPVGIYWEGIYSASRPIVSASESRTMHSGIVRGLA